MSSTPDSTENHVAFDDDARPELFTLPDMESALDGPEPLTPEAEGFQRGADAVNRLLHWLAESADAHSCGIRCFALISVLRPELLEIHTQGELARKLNCTKAVISKRVAELAEMTGGRFTRGWWAQSQEKREVFRKRAKEVHNRTKENHDQ